MEKPIYKQNDEVLVLCEIWDSGNIAEFYVTHNKTSWYIAVSEVWVKNLPGRRTWAPGEVKGIIREDLGETVLVQFPYERIMGKNPLEISKHLVRPFPHEEYIAL